MEWAMKHLDEGALQALLDGELPAADSRVAEAHLAACPACTRELGELRAIRQLLGRVLPAADVSPPVAAAQMGLRSRRARARRWGSDTRQALLRAAGLVALLAGAASAAVPGTPVHRWLLEGTSKSEPTVRAPAAPVVRPDATPAPASGVSIFPEEGEVRVILHGPARGLRVRTRLVEGGRAEVAATGAAVGARFRTGPGRIEVTSAGPGEVSIVLPAEATAAVVEVDGRTVMAKDGDRLRALGGATATGHAEAEFLVGP
jgi:hypothetical protein